MEDSGQPIEYLTVVDIMRVNCRTIREAGGFINGAGIPRDPGILEYLVEIVQARLSGQEIYPTLAHKAALYAFAINAKHVFIDGNKRTSMICALWFLARNHCALEGLTSEEIVQVALDVANGRMDFPALVRWFEHKITRL